MTDVRAEVKSALSVKIPSTATTPPLAQVTPPAQTTAPTTSTSPCCEGGRPLVTDPHTGQTVCSCRLTSPLLAGAYRVPGLPESMYTSAAYAAQAGYPAFSPTDPSTFYSPLNSAYALKDSMEAWSRAAIPATAGVYPYDMAAYPYGYAGMDLNGARRKNATRESTSTLKAWLQEHIKNPYPTKGEKIMLAIITKMTLTQVSTWFANARRRLKKENKMTWSPKNRCDDDDDDEDMKDVSDSEDKERAEERRSEDEDDEQIDLTSNFEDRLASPANRPEKPESNSTGEKVPAKPKIWSLADTATSASPPSGRRSPPTNFTPHSSGALTCSTSVWNPATLYSGAYTYSSPFHQRYGALVPGLSSEDVRSQIAGGRLPAFNGVSVSEAGLLHPAFSGVPQAFRPVEKALIPR